MYQLKFIIKASDINIGWFGKTSRKSKQILTAKMSNKIGPVILASNVIAQV